jgi:2-keto-4-pentenoate hydratase
MLGVASSGADALVTFPAQDASNGLSALTVRPEANLIMLSDQELNAIAQSVKAAQDNVRQMEPLTSQFPGFDAKCAYTVSRLIHEARLAEGAVPIGRKIGFTNPDIWPVFGVNEPVWGYVYESTAVALPPGRSLCSLKRFAEPKLEPEIVVHFHSAPPVGGDLVEILASIDWIAHAFEVVQSHYPGWHFRAPDTIADSALHGALLMGPPQPIGNLGSDLIATLQSFSVELSCASMVRATGTGSNVLGSPLASVAHLIAVLSADPTFPPLQANELVTTGTLTAVQPLLPGETWSTRLQGVALPGLLVQFVD